MARRLGVDVSTIRRLERRAIGLLSATKVNLISPCLFMATRWRHRTTLSRRQDRLSIANLDMWRFHFHILLWSLIVPHLFFIDKIFLQSCLPFNLDKVINIKPKFLTVRSFDQILVEIQAFSMENSLFSAIFGHFPYNGNTHHCWKSFKNPSIEKWGNLCSKNKRNIKRKLKGAHMRALCRGPAKTPSPHRGLYFNRHLASCRHLRFIDCFLTPITPTVGGSHGNAPSIKEALLHPQWKSCELIYYDRSKLMNLGVM